MLEYYLEKASTYAGQIDWLFTFITVLVGFWFIIAEFAIFYFLYRFRKKPNVPASYITGEKKEEKRWISIPHILVILCDIVLIAGTMKVWYHVKQYLPPADQEIRIISQQWAWTFIHPGQDGKLDTEDDIAVVDELHVKENTVYHFKLESKDVLHSFSVPVFRLKQDALPGRTITGWFEPNKTGEFDIQCAEMCGIGHGLMPARVFIESEEDHNRWMAELSAPGSPNLVASVETK